MKIKFYLALITLTLFTSMHCVASAAVELDVTTSVQTAEAAAVSYLTTHDAARRDSYTANPGEIALYKEPTQKISSFLSAKKNVNLKAHASKETKESLITIAIGEKITHFGAAADYLLKDKLAENNLLTLDRNDPYYGHFRVLSLMNDIAMQLVSSVFGADFNIDTAIRGIDSRLLIEIERLSNITRDMFKTCFDSAYDNHKIGIAKHIEKLTATTVEPTIDLQSAALVSSAIMPEIIDSSTDGLNSDGDPLSLAVLTTDQESSKADDVEHKSDTANGSSTLVVSSGSGDLNLGESKVVADDVQTVVLKAEDELVDSTGLNTQSSAILTKVSAFVRITTAQEVTNALKAITTKKNEYKQFHNISTTKSVNNTTHPELILISNYKKALEAFSRTKSFTQINAAKEAYEAYMLTKSATESTGDVSRRNSDASSAAGSTRVLTRRPSLFGITF